MMFVLNALAGDTDVTRVSLAAAGATAHHQMVAMNDTMPFGNRFGFPFTRGEYKRALRQIRTEEEAKLRVRLLYEPDPAAIADLDLLLLAALSEEIAARVIEYRPRLRDLLERVRDDPKAFIESIHLPPS